MPSGRLRYGKLWFFDAGPPTIQAVVNNLYLDTAAGNIYRMTDTGWEGPIINFGTIVQTLLGETIFGNL